MGFNSGFKGLKYPLFSSDLNKTLIPLSDSLKNTQIPNFIKIRPVGAELFHADGQTDKTKLIVAFRNFANEPKIVQNFAIVDSTRD